MLIPLSLQTSCESGDSSRLGWACYGPEQTAIRKAQEELGGRVILQDVFGLYLLQGGGWLDIQTYVFRAQIAQGEPDILNPQRNCSGRQVSPACPPELGCRGCLRRLRGPSSQCPRCDPHCATPDSHGWSDAVRLPRLLRPVRAAGSPSVSLEACGAQLCTGPGERHAATQDDGINAVPKSLCAHVTGMLQTSRAPMTVLLALPMSPAYFMGVDTAGTTEKRVAFTVAGDEVLPWKTRSRKRKASPM